MKKYMYVKDLFDKDVLVNFCIEFQIGFFFYFVIYIMLYVGKIEILKVSFFFLVYKVLVIIKNNYLYMIILYS